ncbi:hypothetical protein D3C81_1163710 [compost metagenome]
MPHAAATCVISLRNRFRSASCRILAEGPTGTSISTCVAPAAIFFDRMDATICASLSSSSARATWISTSSAGLSDRAPPQTREAPVAATTSRTRPALSATGVSTSIMSAVPAGEVIAREDVFGIIRPDAAAMATTIGVVRLPGRPPTQCLSAMIALSQRSVSPVSTMARVRSTVSRRFILPWTQAVRNAAICTSA